MERMGIVRAKTTKTKLVRLVHAGSSTVHVTPMRVWGGRVVDRERNKT